MIICLICLRECCELMIMSPALVYNDQILAMTPHIQTDVCEHVEAEKLKLFTVTLRYVRRRLPCLQSLTEDEEEVRLPPLHPPT